MKLRRVAMASLAFSLPVALLGRDAVAATLVAAAPDLRAEVLTLADMPTGWVVDHSANSNSGEPSCLKKLKTIVKPQKKATVDFDATANGVPSVDTNVGLYSSAATAKRVMAYAKTLPNTCGTFTLPDKGAMLRGAIAAMSFAATGQQSAALQMTLSGKIKGTPVTVVDDVVVYREGPQVGLMQLLDLGAPDITLLQSLVHKAVAKIQS